MAPEVTVVVAVWREPGALADALAALEPQLDGGVEVIVAGDLDRPALLDRHRWAEWLAAPAGSLVPELWARGIDRARGRVVALTTARFVPAPDWLARICEAHRRLPSAGVGGAVEPPPRSAPAADWATYFLRYGAYLGRPEGPATDLAGDNASYRRDALEAHRGVWAGGFWEPEFHRRLLADGGSLTFVPAIRVAQRAGFGVRRFCVQRFRHGRRYGGDRLRGRSPALRLAAAAALPLIPPLLVARTARRVLAHRRDAAPLLRALPCLGLFATAWAVGEVWGYLRGPVEPGAVRG